MRATLQQVEPLLAGPLSEAKRPRVLGWLDAINAQLTRKYGDNVTPDIEPVFHVHIADAIQRRLDKPKQLVDSENAGIFGARWNPASSLGGWFLPEELETMEELTGGGGTRSYRTAAPNGIRYGNLHRTYEEEGADVSST